MSKLRLCVLAMLVGAGACSSNPAPSVDGSAAGATQSRNPDVITADELEDPSIASGDALQAVQRLRPRFLMTHGTVSGNNANAGSVHVSLDGGTLMTVENLSRIRPSSIREIRFLNTADAAQRFGTAANSGGVILVKSK